MINANIKERENLVIVQLFGELKQEGIEEAESIWTGSLEKNPEMLALDLSGIDTIDSVGISHLIKLSRNAIVRDIELVLFGLNPQTKEILKVASLDSFFNIMTRTEFEEYF